MRFRSRTLELAIFVAAFAHIAAHPAQAALLLPGGDTLLNGAFDGISYGATGTAYVTPLLYVGELGGTDAPESVDLVTDLTHDYVMDGLGTSLLTITYSIRNEGLDPFTDLRFMLNVQPDGSGTFSDFVDVVFGPPSPGDPGQFQVGDFSVDPLTSQLGTNDGANGSNGCGAAACDADLALQWDLPQLAPGFVWEILVALSDDEQVVSTRFLRANAAVDETATSLTFSGAARVVPEPGTAMLLVLGLALLRVRR